MKGIALGVVYCCVVLCLFASEADDYTENDLARRRCFGWIELLQKRLAQDAFNDDERARFEMQLQVLREKYARLMANKE